LELVIFASVFHDALFTVDLSNKLQICYRSSLFILATVMANSVLRILRFALTLLPKPWFANHFRVPGMFH